MKLVKYEVQDDRTGAQPGFRVTLWLKDARSKDTKVVTYDVVTNPGQGRRGDLSFLP